MIRTQIQLTSEQVKAAKAAAARRGESMASFIRRAIDAELERNTRNSPKAVRRARASAVVGQFASGTCDVSERHDDYLADAFGDQK